MKKLPLLRLFFVALACATQMRPRAVASEATHSAASNSPVLLGLSLTQNQKVGISVPIVNSSSDTMQILGVQASGDLFIEDFPRSIPAHGTAELFVVYYGTGATSGGTDIVRVLTSLGQLVIPVSHGRPQAVSLSANTLSWSIGEVAVKSVVVMIAGGAAVPTTARALGKGNTASITSLGNGMYRINVQPASTTEASRFPVMVDLAPALPDVTIAISCSVGLPQG